MDLVKRLCILPLVPLLVILCLLYWLMMNALFWLAEHGESSKDDGPILRRVNGWIDRQDWIR